MTLESFVARGRAAQRAVDELTRPKAELWTVELEVTGFAWCHTWTGYATNSLEATHLAACELYGKLGAKPDNGLRVRSCVQVSV